MRRILSVDVGINNLSYVIIDIDDKEVTEKYNVKFKHT